MSSDELINAFNQEPAILQEDLVSLKLGVKKEMENVLQRQRHLMDEHL